MPMWFWSATARSGSGPTPSRRRCSNLERDPRATLLVETGQRVHGAARDPDRGRGRADPRHPARRGVRQGAHDPLHGGHRLDRGRRRRGARGPGGEAGRDPFRADPHRDLGSPKARRHLLGAGLAGLRAAGELRERLVRGLRLARLRQQAGARAPDADADWRVLPAEPVDLLDVEASCASWRSTCRCPSAAWPGPCSPRFSELPPVAEPAPISVTYMPAAAVARLLDHLAVVLDLRGHLRDRRAVRVQGDGVEVVLDAPDVVELLEVLRARDRLVRAASSAIPPRSDSALGSRLRGSRPWPALSSFT